MFRHLLVPTDGSPASEAAARQAVTLARSLGARVTGLSVKPRFHVFTLRPEAIEDTQGDSWDVDLHARNHVAALEGIAREAGVPFTGLVVEAEMPWKGIVDVAKEKGCDAIAMASHGRSALGGLLLGSQTQRVLAHCTLPVVVFR
jgi:nucleotide-binding universal stress UspA family protein